MLSANVCAANYLLDNPGDGIYRNHETPSEEKLTNLRDFLLDFGLTWEVDRNLQLRIMGKY